MVKLRKPTSASSALNRHISTRSTNASTKSAKTWHIDSNAQSATRSPVPWESYRTGRARSTAWAASGELDSVDDRLCFGRLDLVDDVRRYVGRIGISDTHQNPLVMDWRADAAAPFYRATAADPEGVVRRRHIATANRKVTGLDDDVLIIDALTDETRETVTGNDSLLTALDSARTGRMRDIVSTIQAEQDVIIRSESRGVLVVQGGPGTGKSVVALHRVAYLLYAQRDRIARSGALVVGPNDDFLSYIDKVLPALGETGVVLASLGHLYPGINATATDTNEAAALRKRIDG